MIIEEILEEDPELIRRYSDQNMYIKQDQTGIEYAEAVDLISSPYTYTETDHPIETESDEDEEIIPDDEEDETEKDELIIPEEALDIILGGEEE